MKDWSRDYWPLRIGRDTAAIILFFVFPTIHVMATRGAVAATGVAFICIVVMHVLTKGRSLWNEEWQLLYAKPVALSLMALLLWWLISLIWSPDRSFALRDGSGLLLMALALIYLPIQLARTVLLTPSTIIVTGVIVCASLMICELLGITRLYDRFDPSAELWDLNRTALLLTLMLPAIALTASKGMWRAATAVLAGALCVAGILLSQGQSAQLALIVGTAAAALAAVPFTRRSAAGRCVAAGCITVMVAMPVLVKGLDTKPARDALSSLPSANAEHRVALWAGYQSVLLERPVVGWGAGAARYAGLTGQATEVAIARGYPHTATSPHNAPLEIWTELGLIGVALMSLFLWYLGAAIDRQGGRIRVAFTYLFAAAITYSFVSSSLYQGWWLNSLAMAVVACLMLENRHKTLS
ncbi:MAG: O-antigen ligase family protein [Pseudomonadota bacterium]